MKIVLTYDKEKNSFCLAPDECEQIPAGTIIAKSYCETSGFLPTKIVVTLPERGDNDQSTLIEALEAQREDLTLQLEDLKMRLRAFEGQTGEGAADGAKAAGKGKK